MEDGFDVLFEPLQMGPVTLANRVVVPPMVQRRPQGSPETVAWYRRLAAGGAGLVMVESTGAPDVVNELELADLARLSRAIREQGAVAGIQLFPTSPSVAADQNELTAHEIKEIVHDYAAATKLCVEAGFQGVEVHGAHGFLLNRFFMPDRNRRTDGYGGDLAARSRLACQIVEHVREAAGDEVFVSFRHTPKGEAYSVQDSLLLAERLFEAGLDVLDLSPAKEQSVADLAEPFAERFEQPVIAVGGMGDPDAAAQALRGGRCDLVALGRQMIADAEWPRKVQEGRLDQILRCIDCEHCWDRLRDGEPVDCVLWEQDEVALYMG